MKMRSNRKAVVTISPQQQSWLGVAALWLLVMVVAFFVVKLVVFQSLVVEWLNRIFHLLTLGE